MQAVAQCIPLELRRSAQTKRIDGSADGLRSMLLDAGLTDVTVHGPVTNQLITPSAEAYWERFARGAPGTKELLAGLPNDHVATLRSTVLERLRAFGDGPVALPASAYIVAGRKP